MKNIILSILLVLFLSSNCFALDFHLDWNLTFAPPHNEPVVGDKVARYRLQLNPNIKYKWINYNLELNAWGVNTWQPTSIIGHNSEAWKNSDWSIEEVRYSTKHTLKLGPEKIHGFVEYYMPIDRHSWGGHGMEKHYYLLTGFGGRF